MSDSDDVLEREIAFHDELAASLDPASLPPRPPDHLEAALLERARDVDGKDVLDYGCGAGDLTLELLKRGADVTGLDISPGMVELARQRIGLHLPGREGTLVAGNAEATGLRDGSFDVIVGKWILHHVAVDAACRELRRLLRSGGTALFIENQSTNPLLRLARNRIAGRFGIPRYGTEDEHPLNDDDFAAMRRHFSRVTPEYPDFYFFRIFDRQVFRKRWSTVSRAAKALDDFVYARLPRLRRYSFHVIVRLEP
jgi:ubiquinone/menaquinone biosynthesis C-methylase UbiE